MKDDNSNESDTNPKIYAGIPDNSTLRLWLEAEDDNFIAIAHVFYDGVEEKWYLKELYPGSKQLILRSPKVYHIRLIIDHAGFSNTDVTIHATIEKDKEIVFKPYNYRVLGNRNSQPAIVNIGIATAL